MQTEIWREKLVGWCGLWLAARYALFHFYALFIDVLLFNMFDNISATFMLVALSFRNGRRERCELCQYLEFGWFDTPHKQTLRNEPLCTLSEVPEH